MSAINEWFGIYNGLCKYIRDTYGEEELAIYFKHLAKEAYSDVTPKFREGGLEAVRDRYVGNFIKDGGDGAATATIDDGILTIEVNCPAFTDAVDVKHPSRKVDGELCGFCHSLNLEVLDAAGYSFEHSYDGSGKCVFKIKKA